MVPSAFPRYYNGCCTKAHSFACEKVEDFSTALKHIFKQAYPMEALEFIRSINNKRNEKKYFGLTELKFF